MLKVCQSSEFVYDVLCRTLSLCVCVTCWCVASCNIAVCKTRLTEQVCVSCNGKQVRTNLQRPEEMCCLRRGILHILSFVVTETQKQTLNHRHVPADAAGTSSGFCLTTNITEELKIFRQEHNSFILFNLLCGE